MKNALTKIASLKTLKVFLLVIIVANIVTFVDYLIITRPTVEFQNAFYDKTNRFEDSLKTIDPDNLTACVVFRKSSPYLFISLNVADSNFNSNTSNQVFNAAKTDLLTGAYCKEVAIFMKNNNHSKFAAHNFNLVNKTDTFRYVTASNCVIAKWCIERACIEN